MKNHTINSCNETEDEQNGRTIVNNRYAVVLAAGQGKRVNKFLHMSSNWSITTLCGK